MLFNPIHPKEPDKGEIERLKSLVELGLEMPDRIIFGASLDKLAEFGVSLDFGSHQGAQELYDSWLAEQIHLANMYVPNTTGDSQPRKRISLTTWEDGRTPSTRDGYRRALQDYHEANSLPLPEGFWKLNKQKLAGMYHGILRSQQKRDK